LTARLKYQLIILLGSALLALIVALTLHESPFGEVVLLCFLFLAAAFEIFPWLGKKMLIVPTGATVKEEVRKSLQKITAFYGIVFIIATLLLLLMLSGLCLLEGRNLATTLPYLISLESRRFLILFALCLIITGLVHLYFLWIAAVRREHRMREEKLLFQYETLKSQLNPHFLFNSFNALSSLTSSDPPLAERFVQKLSALYHYILECMEEDWVDLEKEIGFVKDYFYLQQIRDEDKIELSIEIQEYSPYKILPVSLQLLVENAFKHNLATRDRPLRIRIYQEGGSVTVANNIQKKNIIDGGSGIGLKNLGERIRHIASGKIEIVETQQEFKVIIPLCLKK
jgi:two-component system LytT family sensor kinase